MEGLEWLAGWLLNTALSSNRGYSAYVLMLIFGPLIVYMRCDNIRKVLSKMTWTGRSSWGEVFFVKQVRPKGTSLDAILQRYLQPTSRVFTTLRGAVEVAQGCAGDACLLACLTTTLPCWSVEYLYGKIMKFDFPSGYTPAAILGG
jgi:hypothetical protein